MKHANIAIFVPHYGCPHHCSFCNQTIISGSQSFPSAQSVAQAVSTALSSQHASETEFELAFFGGSFTAIPMKEMVMLLEAATPYVTTGQIKGIRISTRPDCIDDAILMLLKQYGVTAIELGAQSMSEAVLARSNRGHTAQDVSTASSEIKKHGFALGLQMMTGLPGSDAQMDLRTAQALCALHPDTVRIYPTVVIQGTRLARQMEQGEFVPQSLLEAVSLCAQLLSFFEEAGIPVIRLGLHDSEELQQGYLGGAYHPAFRELVESERLLQALLIQIKEIPPVPLYVFVPRGYLSKMIGQKRNNIRYLASLGYDVTVKEEQRSTTDSAIIRVELAEEKL